MMNTARGKTVHAAAAARPGSGKVPARRGSAGFAGLLALAFGAAVACTANSAYVPALHELSLCAGGRAVWPPPRLDAFAAFIAMWQIMMTAMMLPSVGPALHRYRQAAHAHGHRAPGCLAMGLAAGYLAAWLLPGIGVYLGTWLWAGLAAAPRAAHLDAAARGAALTVAAAVQGSGWKARHLAHCRTPAAVPGVDLPLAAAWSQGWHLGQHCLRSCAGFTLALMALGMTDARIMAALTIAIAIERQAPGGLHWARRFSAALAGAGALVAWRAYGAG